MNIDDKIKYVSYTTIILQFAILAIPFFCGKLFKNPENPKAKEITGTGIILLICCTAVLIISFYSNRLSEDKQHIVEIKQIKDSITFNKNQIGRDSLYKLAIIQEGKKHNDSLKKYGLTLVEKLGEYGLTLDKSGDKIIKAVSSDSLRSTLNPDISVYSTKGIKSKIIYHNRIEFTISIHTQSASATDVKLQMYILTADSHGNCALLDYLPKPFFPPGTNLTVGSIVSPSVSIDENKNELYFFYLKGTCKNQKGNLVKISNFYTYDIKTDTAGIPAQPYFTYIRWFLKNHNIYEGDFY